MRDDSLLEEQFARWLQVNVGYTEEEDIGGLAEQSSAFEEINEVNVKLAHNTKRAMLDGVVVRSSQRATQAERSERVWERVFDVN